MDNNIIIFKTEDEQIKVDVRLHNESVWLTIDQMAELFERDKSTISRHIKNVYEEYSIYDYQRDARLKINEIQSSSASLMEEDVKNLKNIYKK